MRYEVIDADVPIAIAARFGVEVMRVVDAAGFSVQPFDFIDVVHPIGPGDELWISTEDQTVLMSTRVVLLPVGGRPQPSSDDGLPAAHPAFRRWFSAELYDDEADEFAPFGSDEGAEALVTARALLDLDRSTPFPALLVAVLGSEVDRTRKDADGISACRETDPVVIGVAFTLLRITGGLDGAGRAALIGALQAQIGRYGTTPTLTLTRMLLDVEEFDRDADHAAER